MAIMTEMTITTTVTTGAPAGLALKGANGFVLAVDQVDKSIGRVAILADTTDGYTCTLQWCALISHLALIEENSRRRGSGKSGGVAKGLECSHHRTA